MARVISAIFDNRQDVERAFGWLRQNGVPDDAISIISQHDSTEAHGRDAGDRAGEAGSGMAKGLGAGAGVGALFGLAAALIPGAGPFIAAGALSSMLGSVAGGAAAGAIVGGTAGGLAGALSHWGLSEAEAHHTAGEVERGGIVMGVDMDRSSLGADAIQDAFRHCNGRTTTGNTAGTTTGGTSTMATDNYRNDRSDEELRVPLMEETASVQKQVRQAGEVEVTKRVETETQHISEPVARERVTVDVEPVAPGHAASMNASETLQPGQTLRVPVHQEELIVGKQTQVAGEAVIRKHTEVDMATQDVNLRRERVDVDEVGDVDAEDHVASRRM